MTLQDRRPFAMSVLSRHRLLARYFDECNTLNGVGWSVIVERCRRFRL
ncbi:MAG: hypothetical protein HKN34_01730 [Gammaproteobacteria bacterium]|nr:hypothetical protein [Gammaproteobacteria bacterium]